MKKTYWWGTLILAATALAVLPAVEEPENDLLSLLKRPFALERRYELDQVRYYRSSSRYDGISDATGTLAYRYVVSGEFRRKVVGFREDGCALEEFQWKDVKITYLSPQDGAITAVKDLDFAEGFTYGLCFEDDYNDISELVDHSSLPHTLEGLLFFEQIIDSHSPFDWLLTRKHGKIHQLSTLGTVAELPVRTGTNAVDFRPFGYWEFYPQGPRTASLVGLTLVEGQVGAIVETGPADVPTPFDSSIKMGEQTVTQKLITDWGGQVVVSLEDHLPLSGQMYERATPLGGGQTSGSAFAAIHRKISLARISATEFGDEKPE
jgi:hypothetical protein